MSVEPATARQAGLEHTVKRCAYRAGMDRTVPVCVRVPDISSSVTMSQADAPAHLVTTATTVNSNAEKERSVLTAKRDAGVSMGDGVTSRLERASVLQVIWEPTAAPVVQQGAMVKTVLKCASAAREDGATR